MLSILDFDEINKLSGKKRSIPFEEYFGEMELSKKEIKNRIAFANKLHEEFVYIMILMLTMLKYQKQINWDRVKTEIQQRYQKVAEEFIVVDAPFIEYIKKFSDDFEDATKNHEDDPYFFSEDRADANAENEVNTARNYDEHETAVATGKKSKKWITEKDNKVRHTHNEVDEKLIDINDYFHVGKALMRYPHDFSCNAPEELVNCRCTIKYY